MKAESPSSRHPPPKASSSNICGTGLLLKQIVRDKNSQTIAMLCRLLLPALSRGREGVISFTYHFIIHINLNTKLELSYLTFCQSDKKVFPNSVRGLQLDLNLLILKLKSLPTCNALLSTTNLKCWRYHPPPSLHSQANLILLFNPKGPIFSTTVQMAMSLPSPVKGTSCL